jgi:hypothetical protein
MLDENSVIKKNYKLIDFQLRSNIKCIHTIVFEIFDVINIGDFLSNSTMQEFSKLIQTTLIV